MIEKILQEKFNMKYEGLKPLFLFVNPVYRNFLTMSYEYYVPDDPNKYDKIYSLNVIYTPLIKKWKISEDRVIYKYPLEKEIMKKREICPICRGAGTIKHEKHKLANVHQILQKERVEVCSRCNGTGEVCKG